MLRWILDHLPIVKNERIAEFKLLVDELRQSRAEFKANSDAKDKRISQLEQRVREQERLIQTVLKMEEKCLRDQVKLQQYVHDLREYIIFKGGDFREFRK